MSRQKLDLDVAARQAFGVTYDRPKNLQELVGLVKAGTLRMPPQPDWSGNILDWNSDPFGDRNWQFQFHTLRWINPLRWAALEGDPEAKKLWKAVVKSWFESNVPASRATAPFAWKDMADGNRALQMALGAPLIDKEDTWYWDSLQAHVDWLMDDKNIVRGNHALHQNAGLIVAGAVLGNEDALTTAQERLSKQFLLAFDAQGTNEEGSTAYHAHNLSWWTQIWHRLELEGVQPPEDVRGTLENAVDVLAHLSQPDGYLPRIGDSGLMRVRRDLGASTDFLESSGETGTPPPGRSVNLERGYLISRSGWGETRPLSLESHSILRYGAPPHSHAHNDRGSLHVYAVGRPWLVDSGFHSYQRKDPVVDYLYSRDAHNVASLRGLKHDKRADVRLTRANITDLYDDFIVQDDGFHGRLLQRRTIYLREPDVWLIWDTVSGASSEDLQQFWHIDSGVRVYRRDRGFELRGGLSSVVLTWLGAQPSLKLAKADKTSLVGWIATRWKTLVPGSIAIATTKASNARGLTLLISPASAPENQIGVVGSYITTSDMLDLKLAGRGQQWHIRVNEESVSVSSNS